MTIFFVVFSSLKPNTGYIFQVAATNDKGRSPYSQQSEHVKTLEDSK